MATGWRNGIPRGRKRRHQYQRKSKPKQKLSKSKSKQEISKKLEQQTKQGCVTCPGLDLTTISPKMVFDVIWSGRLRQKVVPKVQSCEIVKGSQDGKEFRQGEIICTVWFSYPMQNFWGPSFLTQRTLHHRQAPRWASGHSTGEMWRLDQEASPPPPTLQGKKIITKYFSNPQQGVERKDCREQKLKKLRFSLILIFALQGESSYPDKKR